MRLKAFVEGLGHGRDHAEGVGDAVNRVISKLLLEVMIRCQGFLYLISARQVLGAVAVEALPAELLTVTVRDD